MTPRLKHVVCIVKQQLSADLAAAHAELMRLSSEELDAILRERWEDNSLIVKKMAEARKRRDECIRAVRRHLAEHGC